MALSLLVLTDFLKTANQALDYATDLATPLGARLVLLHVHRDSLIDPELLTGKLPDLDQPAVELALNGIVANLPVPAVAEIGHGRVTDAVADAVRRHHPTLIVLGRPNTEDTPDELVSTTALDLLRTALYPMLVVPPNAHAANPPRRILLAADGEDFSLGQPAEAVRDLFAALQAELTVLHVTEDTDPDENAAAALQIVQQTGLTADLALPIRTLNMNATDPADGILNAARPEDFDLVVLIARPRSFLGELFHHSVSAQVLLHSNVPVLVLPAAE